MDFIGIPIPEEMAAHMERHDMALDSHRHDISRLFQELDKEHLLTLRLMFHEFTDDPEGRLSAYYEGILCATFAHRFDVCPGCGKNHEEELMGKQQEEDASLSEEQKEAHRTVIHEANLAAIEKAEKNLFDLSHSEGGLNDLTPEQLKQMEEYNLDDLRDDETFKLVGFICKGCGLRYESIKDRMLRPVDWCHGCHLKAAHG